MREQTEKIVGFSLPQKLVDILAAFADRFGGPRAGMAKLAEYLGSDHFVHVDSARDYEQTPAEFFPFLATGGGGIHYGYLVHAPELQQEDHPVIDYDPGGRYVRYCGNTTAEGIETIISWLHADEGFADIDIPFLNSIGIFPAAEKKERAFYSNYSYDDLVGLPLSMPDGWSFRMTYDGVGVLAPGELFGADDRSWDFASSIDDMTAEAQRCIDQGFFASALYHLRQAWWLKHGDSSREKLRQTRDMMVKVYRLMGRDAFARTLEEEYKWL
jgi:hypothetical protein